MIETIACVILLALELIALAAAVAALLALTVGPLVFVIWLCCAQPPPRQEPKRPPTDGDWVQLAGD